MHGAGRSPHRRARRCRGWRGHWVSRCPRVQCGIGVGGAGRSRFLRRGLRPASGAWSGYFAAHRQGGCRAVAGDGGTASSPGLSAGAGGGVGYWIVSGRCGCIGGIGFRAAGRHVRARDEWIGWPDAAKAASPGLPVNNHRFLPLPGVAVPNPASHVPDRRDGACRTTGRRVSRPTPAGGPHLCRRDRGGELPARRQPAPPRHDGGAGPFGWGQTAVRDLHAAPGAGLAPTDGGGAAASGRHAGGQPG